MARIDTFFEAFIEERRQSGLGPAGEKYFRDAWTAFRHVPGSHRPSRETLYLFRLQKAEMGPVTARRHLSALLPVLTFLQARRAISAFPLPPRPEPQQVEGRPAMSEAEVTELVLAIPVPGVQALAALVYFTGLRAERLIGLRPQDATPAALELTTAEGHVVRLWSLSTDAREVIRQWQLAREPEATFFFHDEAGQPLTLKYALDTLRSAGRAVNRPAVGFGHLQYAHLLLLAEWMPVFSRELLELGMQQTVRLRYLRIPNLYERRENLTLPTGYVSPAERILKGEKE